MSEVEELFMLKIRTRLRGRIEMNRRNAVADGEVSLARALAYESALGDVESMMNDARKEMKLSCQRGAKLPMSQLKEHPMSIASEDQLAKLRQLQIENREWVAKNFGSNGADHRPLLGIIEELGEIDEAFALPQTEPRVDLILDGIADVIVFSADFCNRHDFDLSEIFRIAARTSRHVSSVAAAGRPAHAQLKYEQGIRGTYEERKQKLQYALQDALIAAMQGITRIGYSPADSADFAFKVWSTEVRPRIWRCQKCDAMLSKFALTVESAKCSGC